MSDQLTTRPKNHALTPDRLHPAVERRLWGWWGRRGAAKAGRRRVVGTCHLGRCDRRPDRFWDGLVALGPARNCRTVNRTADTANTTTVISSQRPRKTSGSRAVDTSYGVVESW